jgi:dipeptidyl aminopeptidase/acylaminoacyl peptidase
MNRPIRSSHVSLAMALAVALVALTVTAPVAARPTHGLTIADVLQLQLCTAADISPDGRWIAYTVSVPRGLDEDAGAAYSELHVVEVATGQSRPFIGGEVNVRAPRWSPDSTRIGFLLKRAPEKHTQVWAIPLGGGEAEPLTRSKSDVHTFGWHADGKRVLYTATTPRDEAARKLADRGFDMVFYEENLRHRNLYLAPTAGGEAEQLTDDLTVWALEPAPGGQVVAITASPLNLVDHQYMFQQVYLIDLATGDRRQLTRHEGKLGNVAFSPDGRHLAYAASRDLADHAVSQAWVIPVTGGEARNLTAPDFPGHVNWVGWRDDRTLLVHTSEGVFNHLRSAPLRGGAWELLLDGRREGVVVRPPLLSRDGRQAAMLGHTPTMPTGVYAWQPGRSLRLLADHNPWLADRHLARQEIVRYPARDGVEIEGLLVYPLNWQEGRRYPLIVSVHGGPEAHYSHGWLTRYHHPAQVLAARGYLAFYPNYRASTGYGVAFGMAGYGDPAGVEFDDVADGIKHLIDQGLADPERVGLGGGSYGGYAAAWFATRYTELVRAVSMFVGISNVISKQGTTDIPWEELYVHKGKPLEESWDLSLERSPIFWAHQSRTAVLMMHGDRDPRVHPAQSLEMHRRLQMNGHPAARLVLYPGEGHGNSRQTGQLDVLCRHLAWYDWYVRDLQPLDGPMPPLDVSDCYGLPE